MRKYLVIDYGNDKKEIVGKTKHNKQNKVFYKKIKELHYGVKIKKIRKYKIIEITKKEVIVNEII